MKVFRLVVGIVIAVVVLVAVAVGLALTPAVQTWAARRAVADLPGTKIDIGHVSAGFSAADLRDVHVVKDGLVVTASAVKARYSAMDYLLHQRVTVDDLTVDGLVIDARGTAAANSKPALNNSNDAAGSGRAPSGKPAEPKATAKTAQPSQPFSGVLNGITLPVELNVARFSVPGRALLPNEQTAAFDIRGSNLVAGQRGTIEWKAEVVNDATGASYRAAHTQGTANVHLTNDRRIDLVEVNGTANAEGPKLPDENVRIAAKAQREGSGNESYLAKIDLVRGQTAEPLLALNGRYEAAAKQIAGDWTLTIKSKNVAALLSGFGLPDVVAEGGGKFTAHPDTGNATANGHIQSTLSHAEKISPQLATIGRLRATLDFAGAMENNVASLEQLTLEAATADGHKLADIRTLQRVGYALADKRITFANAQSELARITLTELPLAWAQPFVKPLSIANGQASLALAVAAEPDGSRVHVTPVEPLTLREVTVRNGNQTLADRLTLSVQPTIDYAADHVRVELNDLAVTVPTGDTVNGRFTADITNLSQQPKVAFTTDTQAKFVALLKPYLNVETGPLTVVTKSDGTIAGDLMHFEHSSTRITHDNGAALAAIELQQPMSLNVQTKAITAPKPDAETLRLTLGQVPLNWAQSYVAGSRLDGQLAGGVIGVVVHSLDDIAANTTTPIALRGVSVAMNGQPMLQAVDLTADFSAAKRGDAVTFDLRKVDGRSGSASLLSLTAKGDMALAAKPTINASGTLNADLAALMQQPAYGGAPTLARGTLEANFDAKIAEAIQANGKIAARNLIAKAGNRTLGDAAMTITAAVQPDGSSVLKIPFTLTNGSRKSDLLVDGKLVRSAATVTFDGAITSNRLIIDDLQPLAGLAPGSGQAGTKATAATQGTQTVTGAAPAVVGRANAPGEPRVGGTPRPTLPNQPAGTANATRDTQPFWSGFGGHVSVDLKRIDYGRDYSITGVRGTAVVDPKQLSLSPLEGSFNGNPFKLAATIAFNDQQPKPYTLNATADVNSFDVGAILRAANPNEKPSLETKVTVNAKLSGTGLNVTDLAKSAYGTFDVNGSQGVLRALGNKGGNVATTGSALLGLAGALQGSDTTVALADLTRKLAELPFDRFAMHVERGADLNLKVGKIEFVSPDTHITGSGGIQNQPGVPIENQPMQFTLQLAGKNDMAVLLNRVKMLNGKQDDQGYYLMSRTFTIGGTPSKPDSSDLYKVLAQVGANVILPGVLKMFGK